MFFHKANLSFFLHSDADVDENAVIELTESE